MSILPILPGVSLSPSRHFCVWEMTYVYKNKKKGFCMWHWAILSGDTWHQVRIKHKLAWCEEIPNALLCCQLCLGSCFVVSFELWRNKILTARAENLYLCWKIWFGLGRQQASEMLSKQSKSVFFSYSCIYFSPTDMHHEKRLSRPPPPFLFVWISIFFFLNDLRFLIPTLKQSRHQVLIIAQELASFISYIYTR